jgi:GDP-L-fucose synthase|tara:strand:+ start:400 stop:1326 length:927 start_codon:yes stop_codon:yes gene_type:complete
MDSNSKIFVAGHKGLVGSAIVRNLQSKGYNNIITLNRSQLDLTKENDVYCFFMMEQPEYVFNAAAKVGGIMGNKNHPADFIYENLRIQNNIIHNAYKGGVKKLIFLGSSCIYPKFPNIPITEDQLMTSPLEESNSAYAIAKIAGMRMCQAYRQQYGFNAISLMPTNLYGINDNFDLENSHVLPAMIRKFYQADEKVTLWGDGSAMREFLHVDDLAEACYVCMQKYDEEEHINIGTGEDVTIKELAETVAKVVGNKKIEWDTSKPNGTPRKVLNVDKIKSLGWEPKIGLEEGIRSTYEWFRVLYGYLKK